ncbi:LexA repressor [compost metagenome]
MKPLTKRQDAALQAIIRLSEAQGYPPTVREIMIEINLTSSSAAKGLLDKLEEKGYIKRQGNTPRAIKVLRRA